MSSGAQKSVVVSVYGYRVEYLYTLEYTDRNRRSADALPRQTRWVSWRQTSQGTQNAPQKHNRSSSGYLKSPASKVLVRGLDMWYQFDIVCYAYDVRVISFLATLLGADTHRAEPAQYKFWILH